MEQTMEYKLEQHHFLEKVKDMMKMCSRRDLDCFFESPLPKHPKFKSILIFQKMRLHASGKSPISFSVELCTSKGIRDLPSEFTHPYLQWRVLASGTFLVTFSLFHCNIQNVVSILSNLITSDKIDCIRDSNSLDRLIVG